MRVEFIQDVYTRSQAEKEAPWGKIYVKVSGGFLVFGGKPEFAARRKKPKNQRVKFKIKKAPPKKTVVKKGK